MLDFKRVGIWGYGVTGAAVTRYLLRAQIPEIHIYDQKHIPPSSFLQQPGIMIHTPDALSSFLSAVTTIIPSPGVNTAPHHHSHRFISEYALFAHEWSGKIIAITGTVGKTSVTDLTNQLLQKNELSTVLGGNIGTPLLDLLLLPHTEHTTAIIELSSFQLELGVTRAPDVALITNLYPNHLDRHRSYTAYRAAKYNLITGQKKNQWSLLPLTELTAQPALEIPAQRAWFSVHPLEEQHGTYQQQLRPADRHYYLEQKMLICATQYEKRVCGQLPASPITFLENMVALGALLDIHAIPLTPTLWQNLHIPEHRLAYVQSHAGIHYYNDSKSTIPEATKAAIQQLLPARIVLFLGGLSKGVCRREFISAIAPHVHAVICFGAEGEQLWSWCTAENIHTQHAPTLEAAFDQYHQTIARPGDTVLLSPAGSSYDLFPDYQARGTHFVNLVQRLSK